MSLICMKRNMDYHSITQYYKTLRFDWLCSKQSKSKRKLSQFALCSIALTTSVARVED